MNNEEKLDVFRLIEMSENSLIQAIRKFENLWEMSDTRLRPDEIERVECLMESIIGKAKIINETNQKFHGISNETLYERYKAEQKV